MESVLAGVTRDDVRSDPFPHIVVRDAVPAELCSRLIAEFPSLEVVTKHQDFGSNKRVGLPAAEVAGNQEISELWRSFIEAHASGEFLAKLVDLFGEHIRRLYPTFERDNGSLESLRAGVRNRDDFSEADVLLDAQISINTPVVGNAHLGPKRTPRRRRQAVRRPLLPAPPRGRLDGREPRALSIQARTTWPAGTAIYDTFVETADTVDYAANTLVLFLNSPDSVHGVTPRSQTQVPRTFVNLIAAVERPLFDVAPFQATWIDKFAAGPERVRNKIKQKVG